MSATAKATRHERDADTSEAEFSLDGESLSAVSATEWSRAKRSSRNTGVKRLRCPAASRGCRSYPGALSRAPGKCHDTQTPRFAKERLGPK